MQKAASSFLFLLFLSILFCTIRAYYDDDDDIDKEELKAHKFPPCAACRVYTNSFKRGLEITSREKFEGGDSAWEEDNLGSYARSEVRLTEIQENLCNEIVRGENQCRALAEEYESKVEDWWFRHKDNHPDIFNYICIRVAQVCCPRDHYGPNCDKCPGYPDNICNNNGKCKGSSTRKGNGACICDIGYEGEFCDICSSGYFESYKDKSKFLCSKCHPACDGPCKGSGPNQCEKCAEGWLTIEGKGCFDINECLTESCPPNTFCVNREGSFSCLACDKACNECTGDGPDMCVKCAEGYRKTDNLCINVNLLGRKKQENFARYATYFGLCIATCIIFQRNIYAASVTGLLVALYISVSEYMIANSNVQDATPNMDIIGPA